MNNPTDVVPKRVLQYIIDGLVAGIPAAILYGIGAVLVVGSASSDGGGGGAALGSIIYFLGFVAAIGITIWNYVLRPTKTGQSIGMQVMKIKVIKEDGSLISVGDSFLRWILLIVDGLCAGIVGLVLMLTDKDTHKRLGDRVAKSIVVGVDWQGGFGVPAAAAGYAPSYPGAGAPGGYQPPAPGAYQPPAAPAGYEQPTAQPPAAPPQAPPAPGGYQPPAAPPPPPPPPAPQ